MKKGQQVYTIRSGDSLWAIAQKHHLTVAALRSLNKMGETNRIHAGQRLLVKSR